MDDRQIRVCILIFFTIILWVIYPGSENPLVMILVLSLPLLLSYALPWFINFMSSGSTSLIFGPYHSDVSYEHQSYQDDMDKGQRLVREEKWDKAIATYREIVQKAPAKCEPRFHLARIYQRLGHLGLALNEYEKIVNRKDLFGPSHAYVLESETAINELKKLMKGNSQLMSGA
jgi:tetratricopeptide (TPR) repeat protein